MFAILHTSECTLPVEYCEYGGKAEKCRKWLEGNLPSIAMTQLNIEQSEGANEKEESPAELDERKKQVNPQLKNISVSLHLHNIVINESNRKEEEKELRSLKRR